MLACERHGSGEPLVLVHGLTHRRQAWYPVLDELAVHREVILVDLPGHGALARPGRPTAGPSPDVLRDDVQGVPRRARASTGRTSPATPSAAGSRSKPAVERPRPQRHRALAGRVLAHRRRRSPTPAASSPRRPRSSSGSARAPTAWPHSRAGRRVVYSALMSHPARVPADTALGDIRGFRRALPALRVLLDAATPFTGEIAPTCR